MKVAILCLLALTACSPTLDKDNPADRALMSRTVWDGMDGATRDEWCRNWNLDPEGTAAAVERAMSVQEAAALISILYTEC